MYTLMHDPQYRLSIAWQNMAYNQPPHTGFYLGHDMAPPPPPPLTEAQLRWGGGIFWDDHISKNWLQHDTLTWFINGDHVLFDISGDNSNPIMLNDTLYPSAVTVYSPIDYTFNGTGTLSGTMELLKAGAGILTINTDNDFTGQTDVWDGTLIVNGILSGSIVNVHRYSTAGGNGTFGKGITVSDNGNILVSDSRYSADTLNISGFLTGSGNYSIFFDLSNDTAGIMKTNDIIMVDGDINLSDRGTIQINKLDGVLQTGQYTLIKYSGNFNGDADHFILNGITGIPYELINTDGAIILKIIEIRDPGTIIWTGAYGNDWDWARTKNWSNTGQPDWFIENDTVLFDDSSVLNNDINLAESLPVGKMMVDASVNYSFSGNGRISGNGSVIKSIRCRQTWSGWCCHSSCRQFYH